MKKTLTLLCALSTVMGCSHSSNPAGSSGSPGPKPSYFQVDAATAGSISGTIHFSGSRPAQKLIDMSNDPACVNLNKGKVYDDSLALDAHNGIENAFVYIKSGLEGKTFAPAATPVTIDQRGCWFHPRVIGVQVGQELDIVNSDPVTHNIHPLAKINHEWNHSQGPGDPPMQRRFTKQEIMIPVKCNIHNWMHARIGVVDHPYFAVSKSDGSFVIPNLPPGTYTLGIWHEQLGTQEQQVTVAPHGNAKVKFDLTPK
jgi:plastocyanin